MPRLIPARPDPDAPDGERFVLEALAAGLPADAVVYHRCRYARARADGRPPGEGELDALAVVPGRGCLVLEIKSGGVRHGPEGWASVDRHGVAHAIRDPADQAAGAARWLRKFGRERGVWKSDRDLPPIEWAVAFPDLALRAPLAPALPRERTLDRDDLRGKIGTGTLFHPGSRLDALLPEKGKEGQAPISGAAGGRPSASGKLVPVPLFPGVDAIHLARLERELAPVLDLGVPLA
ncbi:MAG: NERD domain-containing protein, partial [Thermoanaerobaculia bacterium]|nr:NERD domain-containing protein [Thermoanaerobaculia bacterium]